MKRKFAVILTQDEEQLSVFNVTVPALPGCLTWGRGRAEARANVKEAIGLWLSAVDEKDILNVEVASIDVEVDAR